MGYGQKEFVSPGEEAVSELAEALYKDARYVKGLIRIFNSISPKPKEEEIKSFCLHWLKKDNYNGRFPSYSDVNRFLCSLPSREDLNPERSCNYGICDGYGYIEMKLIGLESEQDYIFVDWCKCVDPIKYADALSRYELTDWQKNYK
jgi:hypothetical protein